MSTISVLEQLKLSRDKLNTEYSQYSIIREYCLLHKQLGATFRFNTLYHEILSQYPNVNLTYSGLSASLSRMEKGGYLEYVSLQIGYKFIRRDANGRPRTNDTWEVPEAVSDLLSVIKIWTNNPAQPAESKCTIGTFTQCIWQLWKARQVRQVHCNLPSSLSSHNVVRAVSSNPRFGD